jgi:hypothetical protein
MAPLDAFPISGLSQSVRRASENVHTLDKKDLGGCGSLLGCFCLEKATPNTFLNISASFFSAAWRKNHADYDPYPNPHDGCANRVQEPSVIGENRVAALKALGSLPMDTRGTGARIDRLVLRLEPCSLDIFRKMPAY